MFGDEVYSMASPQDGVDMVARTIRGASSVWRSVTVVTDDAVVRPSRMEMATLDEDALDRIARGTCGMLIGAYDDTGFLLWSKE
jgi:hypothetical protein